MASVDEIRREEGERKRRKVVAEGERRKKKESVNVFEEERRNEGVRGREGIRRNID